MQHPACGMEAPDLRLLTALVGGEQEEPPPTPELHPEPALVLLSEVPSCFLVLCTPLLAPGLPRKWRAPQSLAITQILQCMFLWLYLYTCICRLKEKPWVKGTCIRTTTSLPSTLAAHICMPTSDANAR